MDTVFGIGVILLVAGLMIYMQFTEKPRTLANPEEYDLYLKSMEALSSFATLFGSLSSKGYLADPEEHEKYKAAMKLLADSAAYFDPKNIDRR